MGKRALVKDRDADTTVLYRKSNQNLILSRTCSGLSEHYTKSGILQIKKRLAQSQDESTEKLKRDLSVETDFCILRRNCKKKMNRLSIGSGKSKYSTIVDTEIGTIEEFQPDTSACGDSETIDMANNVILDTTRVMMNNLKDLLNDWILKHLLSNQDTKSKLETALYSLLRERENERTNTSSSRSTYLLKRDSICQEVKDKKVATNSLFRKHSIQKKTTSINYLSKTCKKPSCHSSPGSHKMNRIISTLSIPRNIHKKSVYKNEENPRITKCIRQRNVMLSIDRSSKHIDVSSFDLLTISTKSFTKRCATYDSEDKRRKGKKIRQIVFLPNASYKSPTDSNCNHEEIYMRDNKGNINIDNNMGSMPSLVKSLFASDPTNKFFNTANTNNNANYSMHDNYTMTDLNISVHQYSALGINKFQSKKNKKDKTSALYLIPNKNNTPNEADQNNPMKIIDNLNVAYEMPNRTSVFSPNSINPNHGINRKTKNYPKNKHQSRKKVQKSHNIHNNRSNYHQKHLKAQNFMNLCQNTLKYFADCEGNKNMKLNIEIKIVPASNVNIEHKCTITSRQNVNVSNIYENDSVLYNSEPITMNIHNETYKDKSVLKAIPSTIKPKNNEDIVPLLDSAASQAKYIFKNNNSTKLHYIKHSTDRSTFTDSEIIKDIIELKAIVNGMTEAAKSFVKGHAEETKLSEVTSKTTSTPENHSREVKLKPKLYKQTLLSGIKLSKEPRKDTSEFYNRVMRRSTSYNIIDSESVIKVTDMTSAANSYRRSLNLRRSSSLNETTSATKRKFFTYYCDDCKDRGDRNSSIRSERCIPTRQIPKRCCGTKERDNSSSETTTYIPVYIDTKNDVLLVKQNNGKFIDANSLICSSSNKEMDGQDFNCCSDCDQEKGSATCVRRVTVKQGILYCFLLWLPVLVVFGFLCMVLSQNTSNRYSVVHLKQSNDHNKSRFIVKLSDLGF